MPFDYLIIFYPKKLSYAIWCGLGLIATTLLDYILFEQTIDAKGWLGLSLITCGIAILTFS
ncbi:multidrug transporter EmrE-like cation transporter [Sporomusaceae bacterium BoRhaA]|uniref:SMR family transporter n=1 Tax=Pelorhabdus rhamnosifermentans TaxID=2772457 RepID=UPI001C060A09|nr:multidrug transporter EmrE-like cation transporter [Pelorhabdus rhamnosifermentans]